MARRRRARPRNRGWVVAEGNIVVTQTEVDNVLGVADELLLGLDIADQTTLVRETSEYFLSRIIIDYDILAEPGALNLSGRLGYSVSLFVSGDTEPDAFIAGFDPLPDYEGLLINTARVLHVSAAWAYEFDTGGNIQAQLASEPNRRQLDLSFRGGVNIREGQGLYLAFSQSTWLSQEWITDDSIIVDWVARMLFTERRPGGR